MKIKGIQIHRRDAHFYIVVFLEDGTWNETDPIYDVTLLAAEVARLTANMILGREQHG